MFKQTRNITIGGLFLSLIGTVIGYIFSHSYEKGLCYASPETNTYDVSCHTFYSGIGESILYGMGALAIVFFILLFVPNAFHAWKKFAQWFVPIAAIIFIFYSDPGSGDLFSPYAEQVYMFIAKLYVVISVGIVAAVYFGFLKPAKTKLKK